MRIKLIKFIGLFVVFVNIFLVYYVWRLFLTFGQPNDASVNASKTPVKVPTKHVSKLVTVIIRDFEMYENDVTATVQSFTNVFPNIQVFVLCGGLPYPPLELMHYNMTSKNLRIIDLTASLRFSYLDQYPLALVKTKYVLFVPDSTRLPNRQLLQFMVTEIGKQNNTLLAITYNHHKNLSCLKISRRMREWTVSYDGSKGTTCDAVGGKHVTMVETDILKKLPNVFLLPFPHSLYLQTSFFNYTVKILQGVTLLDGKPLLRSHHAQWKKQQIDNDRLKNLYQTFRIKKVIRDTDTVDWYGCTRDTPRCFPTVIDSMPSYLYEGMWTPPCCLANLRKTANHVFNCLDEAGVRYWLESGSLLGAMRLGNVLPWDHDVDVGINRDDIGRCVWLEKARNKPTVDAKGFVWERATEGNFFRVHFSKKNRIHVNLFPFFTKNGTMTKDSWFTGHKNMEFPDHFLHPMSSIDFIGRRVPSPNNIRDFLEIKFGRGAIENSQYPDPAKLKFP